MAERTNLSSEPNDWFRWPASAISVALFGVGAYLAFTGEPGGAAPSFAAAMIALIFAFLSRFKRIKGFGVEAEMWQQKMEQADQIISNLRQLSTAVAEPLLSIAARTGRMGVALTPKERLELVNGIERALNRVGVSHEDIEAAKTEVHRYNLFDLGTIVRTPVKETFEAKAEERRDAIHALGSPIVDHDAHAAAVEEWRAADEEIRAIKSLFEIDNVRSMPERLERAVTNTRLLSSNEKANLLNAVREPLEDVRHYANTGEFRRLDAWLGADRD